MVVEKVTMDDVDRLFGAEPSQKDPVSHEMQGMQPAVKVKVVENLHAARPRHTLERAARHTTDPDPVACGLLLQGEADNRLGYAGPAFAAGQMENTKR